MLSSKFVPAGGLQIYMKRLSILPSGPACYIKLAVLAAVDVHITEHTSVLHNVFQLADHFVMASTAAHLPEETVDKR